MTEAENIEKKNLVPMEIFVLIARTIGSVLMSLGFCAKRMK